MTSESTPGTTGDDPSRSGRENQTMGTSTIYRLCEELISLRERNTRQHQEFERKINTIRDELKGGFNTFAADTQKAYQQLRQEIQGEKRTSLTLLNELLEVGQDLQAIVAARPDSSDVEALLRWADSVAVESRKVQDALLRHGIHPYDAVISSPYNPALHERVGSARVEGMGPLLVAEQREGGFASQQPGFVLRRPRIIVSE